MRCQNRKFENETLPIREMKARYAAVQMLAIKTTA